MKRPGLVLALTALTLLSFWLWTPDVPRATLEARYLVAPTDLRQVGPWRLLARAAQPIRAGAVRREVGRRAVHRSADAGAGQPMTNEELWAALDATDDEACTCNYDVVVNGLIIGSVVVNHDDRTVELVPE